MAGFLVVSFVLVGRTYACNIKKKRNGTPLLFFNKDEIHNE